MIKTIKESMPVKYFQTWVIIGLVVGIVLVRYDVVDNALAAIPQAEVIEYKADTVEVCDYRCLTIKSIDARAYELYKENEKWDLERYRQEAIIENRDMLISIMDESSFIDYNALREQYGY